MEWSITYYNEKIQQDILSLPESLLAQYFRLTDTMKIHGPNIGKGKTKKIQGIPEDLFELRLKGNTGIARVMFCTLVGNEIKMLHSFIKKTDKTPKREINTALAQLKEVQRNVDARTTKS